VRAATDSIIHNQTFDLQAFYTSSTI